MTDTRSFTDRRRDAMVEAHSALMHRNRQIGEVVVKDGNRSERWTNVITLIAPPDGADPRATGVYVVEITPNRLGDDAFGKVTYTTVVGGAGDHLRFYTAEVAILHAIARSYGQGDSHGTVAHCAGRVLGVTDSPA